MTVQSICYYSDNNWLLIKNIVGTFQHVREAAYYDLKNNKFIEFIYIRLFEFEQKDCENVHP